MNKIALIKEIAENLKEKAHTHGDLTDQDVIFCALENCKRLKIENEAEIDEIVLSLFKYLCTEEFDLVLNNATKLQFFMENDSFFNSKEDFFKFAFATSYASWLVSDIPFDKFSPDEQFKISCNAVEAPLTLDSYNSIPFQNFTDEQKREIYLNHVIFTSSTLEKCPFDAKSSNGQNLFSQEEIEAICLNAIKNDHKCIYQIKDMPNISQNAKFEMFKSAILANPADIADIITPSDFSQTQLFDLYLTTIQGFPDYFRKIDKSLLTKEQYSDLTKAFNLYNENLKTKRHTFIEKGNQEIDKALEMLNGNYYVNIDFEFLEFLLAVVLITKSADTVNPQLLDGQVSNASKPFNPNGFYNHNFLDTVMKVDGQSPVTLNIPNYENSAQDWKITCTDNRVSINNNVVTFNTNKIHGDRLFFRIEAKNVKNDDKKAFVILYGTQMHELLEEFRNVLAHGMFYFDDLERKKPYDPDTRNCKLNIKTQNKRNQLNALFGGAKTFKISELFSVACYLYGSNNPQIIDDIGFFANFDNYLEEIHSFPASEQGALIEKLKQEYNSKKERIKSLLAIGKTYLNIAYNYEYEKEEAELYYNGLNFQNKPYDEFNFKNEAENHNAIEFLRTALMHGWYHINDDGSIVLQYYDKDTRTPKEDTVVTSKDLLMLINEKLQKENQSTHAKN